MVGGSVVGGEVVGGSVVGGKVVGTRSSITHKVLCLIPAAKHRRTDKPRHTRHARNTHASSHGTDHKWPTSGSAGLTRPSRVVWCDCDDTKLTTNGQQVAVQASHDRHVWCGVTDLPFLPCLPLLPTLLALVSLETTVATAKLTSAGQRGSWKAARQAVVGQLDEQVESVVAAHSTTGLRQLVVTIDPAELPEHKGGDQLGRAAGVLRRLAFEGCAAKVPPATLAHDVAKKAAKSVNTAGKAKGGSVVSDTVKTSGHRLHVTAKVAGAKLVHVSWGTAAAEPCPPTGPALRRTSGSPDGTGSFESAGTLTTRNVGPAFRRTASTRRPWRQARCRKARPRSTSTTSTHPRCQCHRRVRASGTPSSGSLPRPPGRRTRSKTPRCPAESLIAHPRCSLGGQSGPTGPPRFPPQNRVL